MFKTLLKFVSAPVAIAAVLLVGTEPGRKLTRKVVKETVKTATSIADSCKQLLEDGDEKRVRLIEQVKDSTGDIVDKVKDSTSTLVDKVKDSTADIIEEARAELKSSKQAKGNAKS